MAQLFGACCGLLLFSAMIVFGLLAGNPVQSIVVRALLGLLTGYVLGSISGRIGMCIVQENAGAIQDDDTVPSKTAAKPDAATGQSAQKA